MKKILQILCLCLVSFIAKAQEQSEHQLFVGNAAVDYNTLGVLKVQMQVGGPILSSLYTGDFQARVGFPYGILYISPTFVVDGFEVSKGYFTDKVNLKWTLGNNQDRIERINVYRKELGSTDELQLIGSVSSDVFEFNDTLVEGGVLYEYRVEAFGVSTSYELYTNYIDGVGFRNPTATVSGSVSYDGGSPVQDVIVFAEANGTENNDNGSSLHITDGNITIENIEYDVLMNPLTLQSWISGYGEVFKVNSIQSSLTLTAGKTLDAKIELHLYDNKGINKKIELENSYPTGELDVAGNDVFANISELTATSFIHVSVVLNDNNEASFYINGREITEDYILEATIEEGVDTPVLTEINDGNFILSADDKVENVILGDDFNGYLDEVRVWQRVLSNEEIRRDYRRYLSGAETDLSIYLRMDENAGTNVYDLSKEGFSQNKNDGYFVKNTTNGIAFSDIKPTREQLGVFGVTDENGSYTIASIPYSGTGESFVITPSLGVHQFEPASQTVFLGIESSVVNQLNFTDISSFNFNGRAVYNVQNVFNTIGLNTVEEGYTEIQDFGYNKYRVTSNGSKITINKAEYYYEGGSINESKNIYEGGALKKYPVIGLEDAFIYIDGDIVIGSDNQPVKTGDTGEFSISVPIGQHNVEVRKDGHTFVHNGYFPELDTFEFFEDNIDPTWFIDTTRISLIGRVAGGRIESEKPLGFGLEGAFSYTNNEGEAEEEEEIISSNNNIGIANITLKGDLETSTLDVYVQTDSITGEYKASLIPYIYNIKKDHLKIKNNNDINILTSAETLNLLATPVLDSIAYTTKDNTELFSEKFHHTKIFRYNSPVTLALVNQEYETEFKIGDETYDISGLENPLYIQGQSYDITFEVSQNYVNKDASEDVVTKEFYTEGTFNITNNLEVAGESNISLIDAEEKYKYTFIAGNPNISITDEFLNSINVQYSIPGSNALTISNNEDFKPDGVIKGFVSNGGQAFASVAPERPDVILRDPPGSSSFASIEKGTTISFSEVVSNGKAGSTTAGVYVSLGLDFEVSTGIGVEVLTDTDLVADVENNLSLSTEQVNDSTLVKSYTFNQTISTSDEIGFVGSDGDLYIGNAKNVFYGIINNMFVSEAPLTNNNGEEIANIEIDAKKADGSDVKLYVGTNVDIAIGEQPTNTFFIYSQKYIIETLIPELDFLAANFVLDPDAESDPSKPSLTKEDYEKQSDIWRLVVQQNEKAKYDAKNNLASYKEGVLEQVSGFGDFQNQINTLVEEQFFSNQSFDAGVGEFTSAITTTNIIGTTTEETFEINKGFIGNLGGFVNGLGGSVSLAREDTWVDTETIDSEQEIETTISYTLKDNDQYNALSVDVINMFDGYGPVFITKGGATSCPYEDAVESMFYKNAGYDATIVGEGGEILSDATNLVYKAEVKADYTVLTNVPENEGALFTLLLKNNSETQSDLEFIIEVDALTLNGATSNVAANGVNVYIPYNETIEFPFEVYKSSASSNFVYDNIRVYLKSPCNSINASDAFIDVSVEFKKSCSTVNISSPEDNWIFNRAEAHSLDSNGLTVNNTLPVTFTDFNTDFAGFRKIELQYRNASSANWVKFITYYGTEELLNEASDESGKVIDPSDSEYTYDWDVVGDNISDGDYEFRAIAYCTDDVTNISPVISGTINLNGPVVFGTPEPSDGILDVGEDISIRFSEDISERVAITSIKVSGLSNQQEIDHAVSVFLDGGTNQVELPNQILPDGSLTLQFWFNSATTGSGNLISQENGINATLNGNELTFSLGGESIKGSIDASQYNFYSLVYQSGENPQLLMFENGTELESKVLTQELDLNTNSSIFIGGNNVSGNIHDVRFWSKTFTKAQATVAKDKTLTGGELNLLGYWTLDEGHGNVGVDKAKSRNAIVNLDWDIKPKGTAYSFANNSYLSLENIGFVQPSVVEDITLSFWVKTATASEGTILSNGRGNDEDLEQTGGLRNKWSVNMKSDGNLELVSENIAYDLTTQSVADGTWRHVALVVKRGGSINAYVDALETASVSSADIGGISGSKIVIGARLLEDIFSNATIDNHFTGSLDEVRLWNTARSYEQIKRDRYFEIEASTEGLLLYVDFNQEDGNTSSGPRYNHAAINNTVTSTFSILGAGTQNYTEDSPALKPKLNFTSIPFTTVINGDEMIIEPDLTTEQWSLFEGQILDFSVSRLYDEHFNVQLSPVSWSAYVNKQEIEWFTVNQTKEINDEKNVNEAYSFTMDVVNTGGSNQAYTITGLPTWITAESTSGSVSPNSTKQLLFTVDDELAMGTYNANIFLETASEFNDRLTLDLRVLSAAPDWSVNSFDYSSSMNIIGKIKINEEFSRDQYTKVGAFVDDNPRGEAYLEYDADYDSYFVYLTAYSNTLSGEEVTFKIWDAINGKVIIASIDGASNIIFLENGVLGSKSSPVIFTGEALSEQTIALNEGWTWISFYVNDDRFNDVKSTFDGLTLQDGDQIKSQNTFTRFEGEDWFGGLTTLESTKMYKVKLANANSLVLKGNDVDEANINFNINEGWNWLPFPIHRNVSLEEALSFYEPTEGDVIKDQYNFAIYDATSGWSGSLNYMQSSRGYMMKSGVSQTLNYPNSATASKSSSNSLKQEYTSETIQLFSKYNGNMSVISEIITDEAFTKVLVYDSEGVLRGTSPIVSFNDKQFSFISVFSNLNETLNFTLFNGKNEVDVTSNFVFENNKVLGTIKNPIILSLKEEPIANLFLKDVVLYPNPFSNEIIIDGSKLTDKLIKIEIYDVIGALVKTVHTTIEKTIVDTANFANGVYLIKLTTSSGETDVQKMIKK